MFLRLNLMTAEAAKFCLHSSQLQETFANSFGAEPQQAPRLRTRKNGVVASNRYTEWLNLWRGCRGVLVYLRVSFRRSFLQTPGGDALRLYREAWQRAATSDRMPDHMGSCIHSIVKNKLKKGQKGMVLKHEHIANVYALLSFINSSLLLHLLSLYQYNCWGSPNPRLTIQSWHNPLVNCNRCIFCWKDYSTWQSKATLLQLDQTCVHLTPRSCNEPCVPLQQQ